MASALPSAPAKGSSGGSTGGSTGARLSADERREALLDVTGALLAEGGPRAVTMGTVAERAEVTRALVYKHFDNRDDLLVALYRREASKLDRAIRREVVAAPDGFEAKLRAFIGAVLDRIDDHAPVFAPMREVGSDALVREDQRGWDRLTVRYFVGMAVDEFGVSEDRARILVPVLFSGIRNLQAQFRARRDPAQQDVFVDTYVRGVIGALRGQTRAGGGAQDAPIEG